jgi:hypothetical protein
VTRNHGRVRSTAVALVLTLVGCSGTGSTAPDTAAADSAGGSGDAAHQHAHDGQGDESVALASVMGVPDRGFAGPQGRTAQFVVECGFSHSAPDDPIVYPGEAGASHLHVFFGNTATDASSDLSTLLGGATTCDNPLDHAAYWAPAILRNGTPIDPVKSVAYYRPGPDVDPASVTAFPPGLNMIAGEPHATEPQPLEVSAWSCGVGARRSAEPLDCPERDTLRLIVTFPDCWDGARSDSDGHRDHVRYSSDGECPASHPVHIPQLTFTVQYPVSGDASDVELASGGRFSGHADFMNAWDQPTLEREVAVCLHRDLVCGITSSRLSG